MIKLVCQYFHDITETHYIQLTEVFSTIAAIKSCTFVAVYMDDVKNTYIAIDCSDAVACNRLDDMSLSYGFSCVSFQDIEYVKAYAANHGWVDTRTGQTVEASFVHQINDILHRLDSDLHYHYVCKYLPENAHLLDRYSLFECVRTAVDLLKETEGKTHEDKVE